MDITKDKDITKDDEELIIFLNEYKDNEEKVSCIINYLIKITCDDFVVNYNGDEDFYKLYLLIDIYSEINSLIKIVKKYIDIEDNYFYLLKINEIEFMKEIIKETDLLQKKLDILLLKIKKNFNITTMYKKNLINLNNINECIKNINDNIKICNDIIKYEKILDFIFILYESDDMKINYQKRISCIKKIKLKYKIIYVCLNYLLNDIIIR